MPARHQCSILKQIVDLIPRKLDQCISLADPLRHFKKQVYIPLNDGSRVVVNPDYLRKLERLVRQRRDGQTQVSFFDLPFVEELIDENQRRRLAELPSVKKIRQQLLADSPDGTGRPGRRPASDTPGR